MDGCGPVNGREVYMDVDPVADSVNKLSSHSLNVKVQPHMFMLTRIPRQKRTFC